MNKGCTRIYSHVSLCIFFFNRFKISVADVIGSQFKDEVSILSASCLIVFPWCNYTL